MGKYTIKVLINNEVVSLLYLSYIYKIDSIALMLLYEKYGKDVFFFFFIFSGHQVTFTKPSKLLRIMGLSPSLIKGMKSGKEVTGSSQEDQVLGYLKSLYNVEEGKFNISIETELDGKENSREIIAGKSLVPIGADSKTRAFN